MKEFRGVKHIRHVVPESDYLTAQRTARTLNRFYEHRDHCPRCHGQTRCYLGDLIWEHAQEASRTRYLDA